MQQLPQPPQQLPPPPQQQQQQLQLESHWWARDPTAPGPVENWVVVQNLGSTAVTWGRAPPSPLLGDCPNMTTLNDT